jgi:hypothetical protein
VRRRTTEDRHLPPLVGSGDILWSLMPRYSAGRACAKSYAVSAAASSLGVMWLQIEGFRSVWCGFLAIVLGCLLQSRKVTGLAAKELVLCWAKADAVKRAAPAWVPCDVARIDCDVNKTRG